MTKSPKDAPDPEARCPWCSSVVPAAAERCPACGAALREGAAATGDDIPGVTQVDPVLRLRRRLARPNRLVGWLADVDVDPSPPIDLSTRGTQPGGAALEGAGAASVAPPSDAVRREMQRLELEALKAELEERAAEARLVASDAGETLAPSPPSSDDTSTSSSPDARPTKVEGPPEADAPA